MAWLSVGVSNDDLCEKMLDLGLLEEGPVLDAFRSTDRGDFVLEKDRSDAYLDRPFKKGNIHISAPHMYATVLNGLELKEGMSMLNVGSGSGYLSCLAAHILGSVGVCHGIEINEDVVAHSKLCVEKWLQRRINQQLNAPDSDTASVSSYSDEMRLSQHRAVLQESVSFVHGNCFHLNAENAIHFARYDRIYVGAACPDTHKSFFFNLLQVGGILVLPIIETNKMLKVRRVSDYVFSTSTLSNVTFAPLVNTEDVGLYLEAASHAYPNAAHEKAFRELFEEESCLSKNISSSASSDGTASGSSSRKSSPRSPAHGPSAKRRKRAAPSMAQSILAAEPESLTLHKTVTEHIDVKLLSSPASRRRFLRRASTHATSSAAASGVSSSTRLPIRVNLPSMVWIPNKYRHQQFPESFRRAVVTILLCSRYSKQYQPYAAIPSSSSSSSVCGSVYGHGASGCYDSLPTQLWLHVLSFCNRDWFAVITPPLQVLSHELLAERQLHLVTKGKLEEAEVARREAERERDMYRTVMLRMSRKDGRSGLSSGLGSLLSGSSHLLNHIFGDHPHVGFDDDGEHDEGEEEEPEEMEEEEPEEEEEDDEVEEVDSEVEEEELDELVDEMDEEAQQEQAAAEMEAEGGHGEDESDGAGLMVVGETVQGTPSLLHIMDEAVTDSLRQNGHDQSADSDGPSSSSTAATAPSAQVVAVSTSEEAEEVWDDMLPLAASIHDTITMGLQVVNSYEARLAQITSSSSSSTDPVPHATLTSAEAIATAPPVLAEVDMLPTLLSRYADAMASRGAAHQPTQDAYGGHSSVGGSFDLSCATSLESSSTLGPGYRVSLASSLEDNDGFSSASVGHLCDPSRYSEAGGDDQTVQTGVSSSATSVTNGRHHMPALPSHQYSKNIPIASSNGSSPPNKAHQNILFPRGSSGRSRGTSAKGNGTSASSAADAAAAAAAVVRDSDDDTSEDEVDDFEGDISSVDDGEDGIGHFYWY